MSGFKDQLKIFSSSKSPVKKNEIFRKIWESYYRRLSVYLEISFRINEPDDLVQEIMMKVYSRLESYNPVYSFSTWVFAIARNHAIDSLRKHGTETAVGFSEYSPAEMQQPDTRFSPENAYFRSETRQTVAYFLEELPDPQRQISFLRFYEQLSYREINRITSIPIGTLKSHVHQIKSKLNDYYGGQYED